MATKPAIKPEAPEATPPSSSPPAKVITPPFVALEVKLAVRSTVRRASNVVPFFNMMPPAPEASLSAQNVMSPPLVSTVREASNVMLPAALNNTLAPKAELCTLLLMASTSPYNATGPAMLMADVLVMFLALPSLPKRTPVSVLAKV